MKNKYTVAGTVLAAAGLVFFAAAMTNPQLSFSWPNWVSYTLYGFYACYTMLIFFMPRMKNASVISCIILAFEFIALGLIVIFIGTRNTPNEYDGYLSAGLVLSAAAQFANLYVMKRERK